MIERNTNSIFMIEKVILLLFIIISTKHEVVNITISCVLHIQYIVGTSLLIIKAINIYILIQIIVQITLPRKLVIT